MILFDIKRYDNDFENRVFEEIIEKKIRLFVDFNVTDSFQYYKEKRKRYSANDLILFKNAPKSYARLSTSEMILLGKGFDDRIDCKYQRSRGNIQVDNIRGQIERNVIENELHEKNLIFIYDGVGFKSHEIKQLNKYLIRNNIEKRVKIFSFKEFQRYFKKTLG